MRSPEFVSSYTFPPDMASLCASQFRLLFLQKLPGVSASATHGDLADIREYLNDVVPCALRATKVRLTPPDYASGCYMKCLIALPSGNAITT